MNTVSYQGRTVTSFIKNNMSFFSYIHLFYRVEKIERLGRRDASGERGSYGGYVSSFDVFYASSFDVVVTWWKYVESFKEYVTTP